jgi:N-carbamoyl-L-amino-acid hydrolase
MLFIRNQNGSHNPAEGMEISDFMLGVQVLEDAVRLLSSNECSRLEPKS